MSKRQNPDAQRPQDREGEPIPQPDRRNSKERLYDKLPFTYRQVDLFVKLMIAVILAVLVAGSWPAEAEVGMVENDMEALYKVLLVDDEEDVRQAIVRKLDWTSLGFRVVGEAGNGDEALEMALRLEPDIVMTDIKMPFMDGLELCRRVKRLLPGVRVAVFSGFDEFEYAKEAITQQVEEYILKPIDAEELAEIFRRLRATLDDEIARRRDLEALRRHYEESLPLLQQQLLVGLLEGRVEADIASKLEACRLELGAGEYCVAVVRQELEEHAKSAGEQHLLSISLGQLIAELLPAPARYHLVRMPDRFVLLFLQQQGGARRIADLLGQLFPVSRRLLGLRLSIGVGSACNRLDEIARSYAEACSALEYQLLVEPGQCIYIGDIEPGAGAGGAAPDPAYAEELLRQIKIGSAEDVEGAVTALVHHLKDIQTGVQQCQIYLLELFAELLRLIRTYRMEPEEARQDSLLSEGVAMRFATLDDLGRWLLDFCENLRSLARRERKDSVRLLVDRAKQIIADQYSDSDLSLDRVCAQLSVSPAYFSTIFKKETGLGFVSYLTDLRMQRALELLATTDDKTYQIAGQVGYTDPNYFSYVFKKQIGVSPSKYRADRVNGHDETP